MDELTDFIHSSNLSSWAETMSPDARVSSATLDRFIVYGLPRFVIA